MEPGPDFRLRRAHGLGVSRRPRGEPGNLPVQIRPLIIVRKHARRARSCPRARLEARRPKSCPSATVVPGPGERRDRTTDRPFSDGPPLAWPTLRASYAKDSTYEYTFATIYNQIIELLATLAGCSPGRFTTTECCRVASGNRQPGNGEPAVPPASAASWPFPAHHSRIRPLRDRRPEPRRGDPGASVGPFERLPLHRGVRDRLLRAPRAADREIIGPPQQ